MLSYFKILQKVPPELKEPLLELADVMEERLRSQFIVPRDERLSQSEERLDRIEATVEEIVEAQKHSEGRLDRIEAAIEKLAEAQKRTEDRLDKLEVTVEKLAQAQLKFERTFESKMGALGARWGLGSESAFREGMRGLLRDTELKVEHYLGYDDSGQVFGRPDQIELDLVVKDGEVYLVEIKSSLGRYDVSLFEKKVKFYAEKEEKTPSRKIIIAPFVQQDAMEMAEYFDIEVYTDINELYQE